MDNRRSPRRHEVHTKHPRYDVDGYSRGKGGFLQSQSNPIRSKCPNEADVESCFIEAIHHTWGENLDLSEIIINVEEDPSSKVLAKLVTTVNGKAYGSSLYKIPRKVKLVFSPRFHDLSDEMQFKTLVHEAGHLGYPRHDQNFFALMNKKGGIYTEDHGLTGLFQLQGKIISDKRGTYKSIKTFDSREELMKYAKKYVEDHPGIKLRMSF